MAEKPILIHTHFHYQRTGVTRSIENVLPFFEANFETYIAGENVDFPSISFFKMMKLTFSKRKVIVHCHRNNEILRALFLRLLGAKFKLISTRHAESKPSGLTTFLHKATDRVITLTQGMSEAFSFPTTIIGHGVDLRKFHPHKKATISGVTQKNVIACAGRIRKAKGQHILVEASMSVLKEFSDWAIVIVGKIDDQPYFNRMKKLLALNGLEKQVYFLNETPRIIEIYQASHTVVVPSFSEGFSLVCAEAMACGCNVIASKNVGIHSQLISEKENGYLFEAGDVNSLTKLLGDIVKGRKKHLGKESRSSIEQHWSATIEAQKLTSVYLDDQK